ncbi:formate dehydrogenase accessory sulfurtransferase FdhD [Bartonella tamiae]|uniref:Sulfur carrier protein FdhD n=1 Tax=Bartonella tamiae Th239 TaxID=1094558 RepID=J1K016_9HYPH|nr:formate dehydrogenase accessory sulfurtransferase FdhD [Bartonella tamiae]EJF90350.1 formate dehydrogenase family accessory protein FdhD [Bartonella tamiae Th239]EJF93709.1 formate dehydrogenase family accessory protein FdhD [Bartonella tamiae Th307]
MIDREKKEVFFEPNTKVSDLEEIQDTYQTFTTIKINRVHNGQFEKTTKYVVEEVPIALSYHGTTHAVMMATPDDLVDFAYGFSLTEGIVAHPSEIESIKILSLPHGIDVQIFLKIARRDAFQTRRRHMAGPVGCGLCGIESIDAAMRDVPYVTSSVILSQNHIFNAIERLYDYQTLNAQTRAAHAAAFYSFSDGIIALKEDVGRHNALDKLCGFIIRHQTPRDQGFIIVTSRLSTEMVQKAAMANVASIVAVSAPTAEAIRIGERAGMTLIGRARKDGFEIYAGSQNIEM